MSDNQINFRTKFKKLFASHLSLLEQLFHSLLYEDPTFIVDLLWKMTYDPNNIIYNKKYISIMASFPVDDSKQMLLIRNELRYQYSIVSPNFLDVPENDSIKNSISELSKVCDEIVAFIVYSHCKKFSSYTQEEIERCLYLLKNPNENYSFGGIRTLRFGPTEADYLKPYASIIGNILEAIYKESQDDKTSNDGEPHCQKGVISMDNNNSKLTAKSILDYKSDIESFLSAAEKTEELGFDIQLILSKRTDIDKLLKVSELF